MEEETRFRFRNSKKPYEKSILKGKNGIKVGIERAESSYGRWIGRKDTVKILCGKQDMSLHLTQHLLAILRIQKFWVTSGSKFFLDTPHCKGVKKFADVTLEHQSLSSAQTKFLFEGGVSIDDLTLNQVDFPMTAQFGLNHPNIIFYKCNIFPFSSILNAKCKRLMVLDMWIMSRPSVFREFVNNWSEGKLENLERVRFKIRVEQNSMEFYDVLRNWKFDGEKNMDIRIDPRWPNQYSLVRNDGKRAVLYIENNRDLCFTVYKS